MEHTPTGAAARPSAMEAFALLTIFIILLAAFLSGTFAPANYMLAGHDARALFYPWLSIAREAVLDGRLPVWDSSVFSGMPLLANPQVAFWYPPTWLAFVLPVTTALSLHAALHLLIAATGMAVLVRELHRDNAAALLAALTFTFSAFMAARVYGGHLGLIAVYAWVPWLLAATHRAASDGRVTSAIVAGVPLALSALAGHVMSLLYVAIIWTGFGIALASRGHGVFRVTRQMAVSILVGLTLAAAQVVPFLELALHSSRLAAGASDTYAMPWRHLITLVAPEFFGDPVRMRYWSTANFEEYFYSAGLLPLLCLPLTLFIRAPWSRYCVLLMAAGVALAPGAASPAYDAISRVLPLQLDRVPARAMVLFTFGASLLPAGLIAQVRRELMAALPRRVVVRTAAAVAIVAVVAIVLAAAAVQGAPSESVRVMREIRLFGWARVAVLSLMLAAAWSWMLRNRNSRVPVSVLAGLVVLDLWSFSWRLIDVRPVQPAPVWRDAASLIAERDVRVVPWGIEILDENDGLLVGLRSTGGYNTLELATYRSLVSDADPGGAAYDVAAARYVISEQPLDFSPEDDPSLEPVGQLGAAWVYRRPRALAMARLVHDIEVIGSASQTRARLDDQTFDPGRTAILTDAAGCRPGPQPADAAHASILNAAPGRWEIGTSSDAPAVLVLAENAYPGWEVTVDDVAAQPLVAYSTFNAVCIPAGEHRIVWRFRSKSAILGGGVSLVGLAALLAAVGIRRTRDIGR